MSEKFEKNEVDVKSINAYFKGVKGCVRNEKDIMISYDSKNKEKDGEDIIDLFLTQEQAEKLRDTLTAQIELNKNFKEE